MLWRSLREVAQGRFQRSVGFLRGRRVYHRRNRLQRTEEHLNTPVAVGEQAGGVSEVVSLCSDLNRHVFSLLTALIRAMTKVTVTRISGPGRIHVQWQSPQASDIEEQQCSRKPWR